MNIALIGYGKMGHMIESVALKNNHEIVLKIDANPLVKDATLISSDRKAIAEAIKAAGADVAIDFSKPDGVIENIKAFSEYRIPLVVGTTGWLDKLNEIESFIKSSKSYLFYAANFSIGVNMFYKIVESAASLLSDFEEYDCAIWEAHHNQKIDSPSGTALEIANIILKNNKNKKTIVSDAFHQRPLPSELHVSSTRIGSVPGTHKVFFDSANDSIELTHTVRSREGLAFGAVKAAEWLVSNLEKLNFGVYTMKDILK